ncbi:hemolysin III family protein [Bacillus pacificus]
MTRMTQFVKEEIANAITHGIGAILSIPALIILIIHASKHGTASAVVAFTVYGVSMFLLYLFSTLLHSIHHPKSRKIIYYTRSLSHLFINRWHIYSFFYLLRFVDH